MLHEYKYLDAKWALVFNGFQVIAERNNESLDELAVLCIERQALIQASLEVLAGVCCEGEEEQEQVSASIQL